MGRLTVHSSFKSLIVTFPEPMAESICSTSNCPGLRRWPRNLLRMKEKNLRCKFGRIGTSNVGNVNQEGIQEDIVRSRLLLTHCSIWCGDIQYSDYVRICDHPMTSHRSLPFVLVLRRNPLSLFSNPPRLKDHRWLNKYDHYPSSPQLLAYSTP
jgi:hypothetical protein